ncbi:UNVERIFIED_CONTAM: hypothetical protein FKN15_034430 [Acipenser sinensis]
MTAAGMGVVTSSAISSGVPPELPGAPSNLVISNISPRSATLKFRAGDDGKTSISKWIVEGQLLAWPEDSPDTVTIVTITPDFHGTRILGYITGLKKFTWYLTSVLCFTTPGDGPSSSQQLVQTFEDKLPGAPSNLVISNISPRSATLKFRAGDDGKTSISKWIVEGQVGGIGDDEEWRILYEKVNDPDPQVLEIPDLTPFTHYRFRMRQVNIVGSSPASQPSRVIQTLQAPPDVSPSSVTVRTASETSLWLRWVPLPDSEYNGNPETVGYRISVWRADLQGEPRTQVVSERLEREITLEGLKEWSEYLLRIQAFNSVGPGPWSEVVRGRTRESEPHQSPAREAEPHQSPAREAEPHQSPAREAEPHQSPAREAEPHQSPAREAEPHQSPAREAEPHQSPAREAEPHQSPAREAEPHQSPAREAEPHQSPAREAEPHQSPAREAEPHQSPAREAEPHQSPAREAEPHQSPAREAEPHQSPAREAEPHQSPAREAEQHQSPAKGGDYTLLPPPSPGDYTLLPPPSPGDHTLLPPPLLPPQEPEGEELQAQPPEIFWGEKGRMLVSPSSLYLCC